MSRLPRSLLYSLWQGDPQPHTGTLPWLALDLQFPADELGPFAHAALAHPGTVPGPNPCPSSETSASRSSPSNFRVTETLLAPEWRRALVSASWRIRNACVPTSPNGAEVGPSPISRLISKPRAIFRLLLTRDSINSRKGRSSHLEAQVVDRLTEALGATPDGIDSCLELSPSSASSTSSMMSPAAAV